MTTVDKQESDFKVRFISESIVKASGPSIDPYILPLSSFDRLVVGFTFTFFHAYQNPSNGDFASIIATIKDSLSKTLINFYPFAGRVLRNSKINGEILCHNEGVRLVEASANFRLASIDFYAIGKVRERVMLPIVSDIPVNIQVTSYTCGGFSISWAFNHGLSDATGFSKFWTSWCEIAQTNRLPEADHDRSLLLPRPSPRYSTLIDRTFTMLSINEIQRRAPSAVKIMTHYYVEGSTIEKLRSAASENGCPRTRTEALSAYLWKVMARTLDNSDDARCQMGWVVEGRRWIGETSQSMSNFTGNLVSIAVQEENVKDLTEQSLARVAATASDAIREVCSKEHFLDLNDYVECHGPGIVCSKLGLGIGVPGIIVNACHHIPMMSMDFGFGLPSLGVSLPANPYGACHISFVSSGRDDGSWFVSAIIWPKLAAALESDAYRVFRPITADHIFGCHS